MVGRSVHSWLAAVLKWARQGRLNVATKMHVVVQMDIGHRVASLENGNKPFKETLRQLDAQNVMKNQNAVILYPNRSAKNTLIITNAIATKYSQPHFAARESNAEMCVVRPHVDLAAALSVLNVPGENRNVAPVLSPMKPALVPLGLTMVA